MEENFVKVVSTSTETPVEFTANKACISLSGGLDSTCLLLYMLAKGCEVRAFSFDYGQKHDIELKKVKKNIKFLQEKGLPVTHQVINLKDVFSDSASALHKGGADIPHDKYNSDNQKATVIENRNVIFSACIYSKALGWANKSNDNVYISLGIHNNDNSVYPDCRPESQQLARELFRISNWNSEKVDYIAPFVNVNKAEVLAEGLKAMNTLGLNHKEQMKILKNTHSCYDVDEKGLSCGYCGTCQERIAAFAMNGLKDPVKYRVDKNELKELYKKYLDQGL